MNNNKYWTNFYSSNPELGKPSSCAEYLKDCKSLIDMGGNCRDTLFFAANNNLNKTHEASENLDFLADEFTNQGSVDTNNYVYSRFTFHSIPEKG